MFSVITNIYNKKTKGPALMELFTATGKLKKIFVTTGDVRCVHQGDAAHIDRCVHHGWHGTHRYDIQVLANTRVNKGASIFFTAVMIRAFRSARSRGNGGTNTWSLTIPSPPKKNRVMRVLRFSYNKFLQSRSTLWNALYIKAQKMNEMDYNVDYWGWSIDALYVSFYCCTVHFDNVKILFTNKCTLY
jgi:hypothetical protein